jgi:hypothetical protein
MAPPDTDEGTSGPLAYLLAVPLLLFMFGVPAAVFTVVFFVTVLAVDSVVGVPAVTLGLFELAGLPGTVAGVPLLYSVVPGVVLSGLLMYWTGLDWEGTDSTPSTSASRRR